MQLVFSRLDSFLNDSLEANSKNISYLSIAKRFSSLEARIMVVERYLFRVNQIEEMRSSMCKIA